jgi:hypothetical protein
MYYLSNVLVLFIKPYCSIGLQQTQSGILIDVNWFYPSGQYDFAAWTMHFLMMSKRPTNASLIQSIE